MKREAGRKKVKGLCDGLNIQISLVSLTVIVHHIFAALPLVWQRYHFGTIFRTPWGSKHCFHGNIGETHIDKRIGAAVFSPMTNETSKAEGVFSR